MTNYAFTDLPPSAGLADTDLFAVTDDPAGTPASQQATAAQVASYVHAKTSDMTEATSMDESTDFVPARVGGNTRKVSPTTIFKAATGLSLKPALLLADGLIALNSAASNAPVKTTADGVIVAAAGAETTTYPSDPLIVMIDDGASDAMSMTPENVLKGVMLNLTALSAPIVGASDRIPFLDASTGAIVWVSPDQLGQVRQTIWLPARAWKPRTTNGPAEGNAELSSNKRMVVSLDFDASTQEYAQFSTWLPKSWDLSSLAYRVVWTTATGSGGVTWSLACRADSDDDALDQAMGTAVLVADTRIADNDLHITAESAALNAGGTPAELDLVTFEISRAVADGGDTKTGDAKFLGLHLYFNTRLRTDA